MGCSNKEGSLRGRVRIRNSQTLIQIPLGVRLVTWEMLNIVLMLNIRLMLNIVDIYCSSGLR